MSEEPTNPVHHVPLTVLPSSGKVEQLRQEVAQGQPPPDARAQHPGGEARVEVVDALVVGHHLDALEPRLCEQLPPSQENVRLARTAKWSDILFIAALAMAAIAGPLMSQVW